MRPMPRTGESGGSSGWRASLTPASSAAGTARSRNQARVSQSVSSSTGASCGWLTSSQTEASKAVTSAPAASRSRDRRARPGDDGHPVVTPHLDPELPHHADQLEHRRELLVAAGQAEPEPVHGRVVLEHGEPEAGVLDLLPVERERAVLPRLLGRVRAPVDVGARQDAGGLVDAELAELRPGGRGAGLEEDLGEAEHWGDGIGFAGVGLTEASRRERLQPLPRVPAAASTAFHHASSARRTASRSTASSTTSR